MAHISVVAIKRICNFCKICHKIATLVKTRDLLQNMSGRHPSAGCHPDISGRGAPKWRDGDDGRCEGCIGARRTRRPAWPGGTRRTKSGRAAVTTGCHPVPKNSNFIFNDPDEYLARLLSAGGYMTLTKSGPFKAELQQVTFNSLQLQRGSTTAAHITRMRAMARAHFMFLPQPDCSQIWAGRELRAGELFNPPPGYELIVSTGDAAAWSALSLPPAELSRLSIGLIGTDLGAYSAVRRFETGSGPDFTRLLLLCNQAQRHAAQNLTPAGLRHWDDALLRALFRCLVAGDLPADRSAARRRSQIIQRLHAVLDEYAEEPLELTDVCLAVGTTLSTLHLCCQEFLGMSPARYLRLRRMNLAHRALLNGVPGATNVTEIALRYGFWELGRFAEYYRRLFAETPSATLNRTRVAISPDSRRRQLGAGMLR